MLKFKTITIIFFLLQYQSLLAQKLLFDGNWKYSLKDDPAFSLPAFNDTKWKEKAGNNLVFTKQELAPGNGSRYTLLRKTIVIPTGFKKHLSQTGALAIFLGKIHQSGNLYFNGKPVSKTSPSESETDYLIGAESIRWDKPNSIALRIRHGYDKGGVEAAPPYLAPARAASIFELSASAGVDNTQQVDKNVIYHCTVINHSVKEVKGEISAVFYDFSRRKLDNQRKTVTLAPGKNTINFPYKSPSSFLKINYALTIPEYAHTDSRNDEYGYQDVVYKPAQPLIADKVKNHFAPADFNQQVVKGWLGGRMAANEQQRLYKVDEKGLLGGYINRPGNHEWIGEHVGKFLDAASNTYKNTQSSKLKLQLDRTAQQLIATQLDNGYLGTYAPENHWKSWDVWSHKYSIIGLLSYYSLSGFEPALDAAKKAGNLLCQTFGSNQGQKDIVAAGYHVGMAATSILESMVNLYRYTGDKKYLDFCYYVIKSLDQENGPKIISTLNATGGRVDKTANAKAYEMLSNLVGITELYKVTGDEQFLRPVLLAWKDIVTSRLYITGAASSFEKFKDDGDLPAGVDAHMGEGCVTTTWMQLNYHLLCISGEMKYVNELERSVYNHLTGAENPESGCVSYYTPLVGVKPYSCKINSCCMSSVPRGISMIPLFANGKINDKPSFLFYQPGTYTTTVYNNSKVSFTTVTNFPSDGNIVISVSTDSRVQFPIEFRKPYWAEGFSLVVNGEKQKESNNETVTINRTWRTGDNIAINFDMPVKVLDGGRSYPGYIALQKGPQVLAFDKSVNGFSADIVSINPDNIILKPAISSLPKKWIGGVAYLVKANSNKADKNIILVPYADASQTGGSITTWIKSGSIAASVKKAVIAEANFEKGDLSEVSKEGSSATVVNNPAGRGKVVKCTINQSQERSEILLSRDAVGTERWYGWSIYLDPEWKKTSKGNIITQWHRWQPCMADGSCKWAKANPMALKIDQNNNYNIDLSYGGSNTRVNIKKDLGINYLADRGKWVHWAAHAKWSTGKDGFFILYKNGKEVYKREGAVWLELPEGPYFKAGIYTGDSNWEGPSTCAVYIDDIRIANANSSLCEVSPKYCSVNQ